MGKRPNLRHCTTMSSQNPMPRPSLLFVTPDNSSLQVDKSVALVTSVLEGGASMIQVRDRNGSPENIHALIQALMANGVAAEKLIVNGIPPADVLTIDSSLGIHIKEQDIEDFLPEAELIMSPHNIIGCAVHSPARAREVMNITEPSYLHVGTMFETPSHPGKKPEGPRLMKDIRDVVGKSVMLIGIGGIDETNLHTVFEHGADGIAIVSLLATADDPCATSKRTLRLCQKAYNSMDKV